MKEKQKKGIEAEISPICLGKVIWLAEAGSLSNTNSIKVIETYGFSIELLNAVAIRCPNLLPNRMWEYLHSTKLKGMLEKHKPNGIVVILVSWVRILISKELNENQWLKIKGQVGGCIAQS